MKQIRAIALSVARTRGPFLTAALTASTFVIGSISAWAGELQVTKFKYEQPAGAKILVCSETVAPASCDETNAVAILTGPPRAKDLVCGVQGPQMLAGSGLSSGESQYVKVVCARTTARAD